MKAGVMLADFTPSGIAQPGLFDEIQPPVLITPTPVEVGKGNATALGKNKIITQWTEIPIASF
ncbi:hypothetical protein NYV49_26565 [Escherichia coli]|nr:hypothetical protein [Escherichia coli]